MARTCSDTLAINCNGSIGDDDAIYGTNTPSVPTNLTYSKALTTGSNANQANKVYYESGNVTSGADETLDLSGSMEDILGGAIVFTTVRRFIVKNNSTSNVLNIGGGSNAVAFLANAIPVRPGGVLILDAPDATGYAVTAGTGDLVKISAAASAIAYEIKIVGS